jgi:acyl-coenzyme A thioesterase PaaI-like protein
MAKRKAFKQVTPSAELKAKFASAPWTADLFSDPTLHAFVTDSLHPKAHPRLQTFTAKTLSTEDTISAWQSFYRTPSSPGQFLEIISLLKLGSGVNGHVDTCHGGFISVILDEIMGYAAQYENPLGKGSMTAYLKVDYKSPVKTPGVIMTRSWVERIEVRKMWGRGTIEDGMGNVLSTGEALFLVVEPVKPTEKL